MAEPGSLFAISRNSHSHGSDEELEHDTTKQCNPNDDLSANSLGRKRSCGRKWRRDIKNPVEENLQTISQTVETK